MSNLASAGQVTFKLYGSNSTAVDISANVVSTDDLRPLADAINAKAASTGITAQISSDNKSLTLVSADGYDIKIDSFGDTSSTSINGIKLTAGSNSTTLTEGGTDAAIIGGKVTFTANSGFSVTSTATDSTIVPSGTGATSSLSSVASINIGTQQGANDAVSVVDGALAYIDDQRATLGAIQNRFSSVVSSNQVTSENVAAARSRVLDADFAAETANLSRAQILQQAGTAMLAQANASTQNVLTLLR